MTPARLDVRLPGFVWPGGAAAANRRIVTGVIEQSSRVAR
jgi:hypothetical protein